MGGTLQQNGRNSGGKVQMTQTEPASLLRHPDAVPQGAQDVAHRCEWRAWLAASPPYVSYSHISPYHTASLFIDLPQTIPEVTYYSVTGSASYFEYVWKDGKSLRLLCAASSQSECLPFWHMCAVWHKSIPRISACEHLKAWEVYEWRRCILQRWYKNVKTRNCSDYEQKVLRLRLDAFSFIM